MRISDWSSDVCSSDLVQAAGVAAWRGLHGIDAIHASPRRRTVETASIIAQALGLEVVIAPDLDEVDFGSWNGRSFPELEQDPRWRDWNRSRSRSEERRGGKECVSTCRSWWAHVLEKKKTTTK